MGVSRLSSGVNLIEISSKCLATAKGLIKMTVINLVPAKLTFVEAV